ncbi:hypothetical protein ACFCWY_08560 [Streptomyces sp. NPDC056362]|uniref:hypothetical protein n=1 Tax=unclassified Streptomyces TaxID=2593676 RepID=UPI0035DBDFDC
MTPYERLMAEAIPTGTFGGPRTETEGRPAVAASTASQQATRRAVLEQAQHGWRLSDERSERNRERTREAQRAARADEPASRSRHLCIVRDDADAA